MKQSNFTQLSFHLARQTRASRAVSPSIPSLNLTSFPLDSALLRIYRAPAEMLRIKKAPKLKHVPHHYPESLYTPRYSDMESAVEACSFFSRGKPSGIDASGYARHYYTMKAQLKLSSIKTTILVDLEG